MKIKTKKILLWSGIGIVILITISAIILLSGSTPRKAIVFIPHGATEEMVRDTLVKAYGEDFADKLFATAASMNLNLSRYPGRYEIPAHTSRLQTALKIGRGRQTPVKLVINNLRTRDDILRAVSSQFNFSPEKLDSVLNSPLMKKFDLTPENATAVFLDNTFEAWWTDTPEKVIERVGKNYNNFWTANRKNKAGELGLTPAQVVIIASITEEESNQSDELGRIGRLYINRFNKGMRLQADPTVRFALNDFTIRRVGLKMLRVESPYNTYLVTGLPPGPIRTVESSTIDKILSSEPSEDLFMCASPDFSGHHRFAADYEEHQRNALEYQRALDAKGIK